MRVYIAGPMTGLPDHNFPAFRKAALDLRACGYDAVSPVEVNENYETDDQPGVWHLCMRRDIAALMSCDAIAMLPGWMESPGATLERYVAAAVYMPCHEIKHFLQPATSRPLATQQEASHHE